VVAFPKPKVNFTYQVNDEIAGLRQYEQTAAGRDIPDKASDRLLIASWNIANLGVQQRRDDDYRIIADLISWFDLIALQEVNDNLEGLRKLQRFLPPSYNLLFSDTAGNSERLTFVYDSSKVALLQKVGEIAIPPSQQKSIKLPGIAMPFDGFDRNPYLAAFRAGSFSFILVNVHLYFGKMTPKPMAETSIQRRSLETYAVARWADNRRRSKNSYLHDVIAIGDFNLPRRDPEDPVYRALTRKGLKLPKHFTAVGSSLSGEDHYDQVAFHPAATTDSEFSGKAGVFDYDGAIFNTLWDRFMTEHQNLTPAKQKKKAITAFRAYLRYYISDHRPLWVEFKT
jgi:endonuclease/exonuclease/phosphatase family metal-dependent hydrolase